MSEFLGQLRLTIDNNDDDDNDDDDDDSIEREYSLALLRINIGVFGHISQKTVTHFDITAPSI